MSATISERGTTRSRSKRDELAELALMEVLRELGLTNEDFEQCVQLHRRNPEPATRLLKPAFSNMVNEANYRIKV